ncbi:hypothetical protein L218DRAFT_1064821 [Marasmius fiardii PR-910]|nr:hypothetical protein L218DRAFT_1064821 [Marasmius fiardii PR-910]
MSFSNVSDLTIHGDANNYICRDQIINSTQVIHQQQKEEHTIYDEFHNVKLGAIYTSKDISFVEYPRRWDVGVRNVGEWGKLRVDRRVSTVKIHPEQDSKYTVVSYDGPEAEEAWERLLGKQSNIGVFGYEVSDGQRLRYH